MLKFEFPLSEIIVDFFDKIKSMTKGYGTLDYEFTGFKKSEVVKLVIHIMNDPVDTLSFMVHKDKAQEFGKSICKKLKERIPPELFVISIQAKIGGKSVAKEDIPCMRKNVTAKCYGGDYTRKKKLLDRQKEGKKKMRQLGKVSIDKDTFVGIIKNDWMIIQILKYNY